MKAQTGKTKIAESAASRVPSRSSSKRFRCEASSRLASLVNSFVAKLVLEGGKVPQILGSLEPCLAKASHERSLAACVFVTFRMSRPNLRLT